MKFTSMEDDMKREIPLSEQTIIKHKYNYGGLQFVNDFGYPCRYRLTTDGRDTGRRVIYTGGRLLIEYAVKDGDQ